MLQVPQVNVYTQYIKQVYLMLCLVFVVVLHITYLVLLS